MQTKLGMEGIPVFRSVDRAGRRGVVVVADGVRFAGAPQRSNDDLSYAVIPTLTPSFRTSPLRGLGGISNLLAPSLVLRSAALRTSIPLPPPPCFSYEYHSKRLMDCDRPMNIILKDLRVRLPHSRFLGMGPLLAPSH